MVRLVLFLGYIGDFIVVCWADSGIRWRYTLLLVWTADNILWREQGRRVGTTTEQRRLLNNWMRLAELARLVKDVLKKIKIVLDLVSLSNGLFLVFLRIKCILLDWIFCFASRGFTSKFSLLYSCPGQFFDNFWLYWKDFACIRFWLLWFLALSLKTEVVNGVRILTRCTTHFSDRINLLLWHWLVLYVNWSNFGGWYSNSSCFELMRILLGLEMSRIWGKWYHSWHWVCFVEGIIRDLSQLWYDALLMGIETCLLLLLLKHWKVLWGGQRWRRSKRNPQLTQLLILVSRSWRFCVKSKVLVL